MKRSFIRTVLVCCAMGFTTAAHSATLINYNDIVVETFEGFGSQSTGTSGTSTTVPGFFSALAFNGFTAAAPAGFPGVFGSGGSGTCGNSDRCLDFSVTQANNTLLGFNSGTTQVGFELGESTGNQFELEEDVFVTVNDLLGNSATFDFDTGGTEGFLALVGFEDLDGIESIIITSPNVFSFRQFTIDDVITSTGSSATPIPLPAGLPLLLSALGFLGIMRRARVA